jgi:hypothetical protein
LVPLLAGRLAPPAGGGVGALAGRAGRNLYGLSDKSEEEHREHARRPAGTVVAVTPAAGLSEETLVRILRANDPVTLEETEGEWRDGEWKDFDPLAAPKLR